MQYTKKATNQTIAKRIADFKPRWKSLAISPASYNQKLLAVRAVAWSQTLHGIASTVIGPALFDTLRTEALRVLGEHKPGASPTMRLALVEHTTFDPGFQALLTAVRMARQYMQPDRARPMLTLASQLPRRKRARVGPCHVLLHNIRILGWEWESSGYLLTLDGNPIDLWQCPIQNLMQALDDDDDDGSDDGSRNTSQNPSRRNKSHGRVDLARQWHSPGTLIRDHSSKISRHIC